MEAEPLSIALDKIASETEFSGGIYVCQSRKVLYQKAFGYADRSNKIPNSLGTRFGIASGTKFFTALAIGKLIEAGKLDFSSKIAELIPWDFQHYSREITVRQLLTHTSGIPDYYDEEKVDDFDNFSVEVPWYELKGPRDYLSVFPDEAMKFPPGERFSYSNSGYILLGVLIEEISGMPYREFVEKEILAPAGMDRSGYFAMNRLPQGTAFGYVEDEEGWRTNIYNLPVIGASDGGAYTTIHDIEKLWDAFWGYKILPREMVEIYTAPYVEATSEGANKFYGHGIWIRKGEGLDTEEYIEGSDAGVSFYSGVIRAKNLLVTVISNTSEGAWPILRMIYQN
ncbi:MAG: serine hydrolase domain-containing protein [Chloroflexota bacterium]